MNNHWLLIFFMLLDWQSLEFLLLFILWMWKVQPTNPSSATATRKKPLEKAADGAGEVLQRKNYASLVISNHLHLSTDFSLHWTVKADNLLQLCVLDQWCVSHTTVVHSVDIRSLCHLLISLGGSRARAASDEPLCSLASVATNTDESRQLELET